MLDRQRRALVAMILADAYAADPHRTGFDSLEEELRDLLRRDRMLLWPAELGAAHCSIGAAEADDVIAFATMIDGLRLPELKAMEAARGQPVDRRILRSCGVAVGKPITESSSELGRLEPDLMGEFFVLEALGGAPGDPFVDQPHSWMPATAWRTRAGAMWNFVNRAKQNFPNHRAIARIGITVEGVMESWFLAALDTISKAGRINEGVAAARQLLLAPGRSDLGAAIALAEVTTVATAFAVDLSLLNALLSDLSALQTLYPGVSRLRGMWAQNVHNFVHRRATEDPGGCRALLNELAALHATHSGEPWLREHWAAGVVNFIHRRAADDPADCRSLLDDLAAVYAGHPEEPWLRENWATSVMNFIGTRAADDPADCGALLNDLAALHVVHRDEPRLREDWASSVMNFIVRRSADDPEGCRALLNTLATLHDTHSDEQPLREQWATSVMNFIDQCAADDPTDCRALIDDLAVLCTTHPEEMLLRHRWAASVPKFVDHRAAGGPDDLQLSAR